MEIRLIILNDKEVTKEELDYVIKLTNANRVYYVGTWQLEFYKRYRRSKEIKDIDKIRLVLSWTLAKHKPHRTPIFIKLEDEELMYEIGKHYSLLGNETAIMIKGKPTLLYSNILCDKELRHLRKK